MQTPYFLILEKELNGLIEKDPLSKWMNAENIQYFLHHGLVESPLGLLVDYE